MRSYPPPYLIGLNATNCDVNSPNQSYNQGCSILGGGKLAYGEGFNAIGGGIYATLWDPELKIIAFWFFPRGSKIPADVTSLNPQPAGWGKPYALFTISDSNCPPSNFRNHTLIFDTALCGSWAGTTFQVNDILIFVYLSHPRYRKCALAWADVWSMWTSTPRP